MVHLFVATHLLLITDTLPMTVETVIVRTVIIPLLVYAITCMVVLGALVGMLGVVLREVLLEYLDDGI